MIDIEVVDKLFEAGRASGSPMQFRLFDKRVLLPLGQLPEAVAREAGDTVSEGDLHALAAEGGSLCCPVPALKSGLYVLALKRGRTSRGGSAELKVTKRGGKYYAAIKQGGAWSSPDEIVPCKDEDYAQLFGPSWKDAQPLGLRGRNGPFGIFKVRKGSSVRDHTFKTGFFTSTSSRVLQGAAMG